MEVDMDIEVDYHDSTSVVQKLKLIPNIHNGENMHFLH